MAFFWVNLGTSYQEVAAHNFLWAPAYVVGKNGKKKTNAGWDSVKEVKAGDVIFCHRRQNIIYVAVARETAYPAKRPQTRTFKPWNDEGFRIDVDLTILAPPVSVAGFKPTLMAIHNQECSPALFTRTGDTAQQYMIRLPLGAGALILSYLGDAEVKVCEQVSDRQSGRLTKGSTRETVAQARVGQGQFRDDVLALWQYACPVTGLSKPELLTASHIVPWSLSNETEKIDPNNGFPLSPALDKLFDRGYVSFDDQGLLLVKNSALNAQDQQCLGIAPGSKISGLNAQQKAYLARHRQLNHFLD
ncbi:HNH endonuclease signature motif containing protein [Zoogloea sp.]|uniref:HNH endonuclease n=1 Tax=Zoogloea sp. TaxID=49181 RepID=UPI001416AE19|nr:MAG: HNH endonuclease [Zoogloea sp.]